MVELQTDHGNATEATAAAHGAHGFDVLNPIDVDRVLRAKMDLECDRP
jgi:hypothetical protein